MTNAPVLLPMASMNGRISDAPRAQFKPMLEHRERHNITQQTSLRICEETRFTEDGGCEEEWMKRSDWFSPQRLSVRHTDDERLARLTRECAAALIYDSAWDLHTHTHTHYYIRPNIHAHTEQTQDSTYTQYTQHTTFNTLNTTHTHNSTHSTLHTRTTQHNAHAHNSTLNNAHAQHTQHTCNHNSTHAQHNT